VSSRCARCDENGRSGGRDQVFDLQGGTTWDLDITDYGPDGSWSVEQGARRG